MQLKLLALQEIPGEIDEATFVQQAKLLDELAVVLYGRPYAFEIVVETMRSNNTAAHREHIRCEELSCL